MASYFNKGTASITTGNTSVTVTHGLSVTPNAADIIIMPITTWGAAGLFWVDTITASDFKINVNINPLATVTFGWRVDCRKA